jgi:prepilin-type N-terminal cleavage/methylation domain-containing protein
MTSGSKWQAGFTILEMLVAIALLLTVTAGVFTVLNPSTGIFQTQPEVSDVQQRLRVGVDTLQRDLMLAGAGAYSGAQSGPLNRFFAAILPSRRGRLAALDDGPGAFRADAVTIVYVPSTPSQSSLSDLLPSASAPLAVKAEPGCPVGLELCGLEAGMQALIYDETGAFDTITITSVAGGAAFFRTNHPADLSKTYAAGAKVVRAEHRVYFLDEASSRLMRYDGHASSVPVLDNVVGFELEYYGEPSPPSLRRPGVSQEMTYGPSPPAPGAAHNGHAPGENCVIQVVNGLQVPRLAVLGLQGLVRLGAAELTDGPWCPNDTSPTRFDADLLRVRTVRASIRVQTGDESLRWPAGRAGSGETALFRKPGTGSGGYRQVPDQAIRFDVTPRNLNAGR